ncbi:phenylacetaldehyde reductase isoform X2 [Setaria viridis]|uniref:phenylacetaldehyde reductase isoform X2 n=1 Tax=Setaria viridis TaxID=4556 RepID=UPI0014933473|nr:tetraketide alpha-pyrone reductase 1-like isoform X2 [Setaria viridis]
MANGEGKGETVVVTGASGFIGSTLVRRLLDRGYNVHAGVLNPDDKAETDHLLALAAGAGEGRLRIFRCDLLDRAAILDAARGCSGVFHLASPCTIDPVSDPQKQLIVPAVEGTLNVLRAAKEAGGVRRVVLTSSNSAIMPSPGWPAGEVPDERCWTDIDYCEKNGLWYSVSKTLAEKAAWKFAEENGVDVAVVNPGAVMGPIIPPTINSSMSILLRLLQGRDCRSLCSEHRPGTRPALLRIQHRRSGEVRDWPRSLAIERQTGTSSTERAYEKVGHLIICRAICRATRRCSLPALPGGLHRDTIHLPMRSP